MLHIALVAASLVVSQTGDAPQQKVAVPDFAAPAGQEALGVMLSGVVAHELERLQLFKVTTAEQVRVVLSQERQKQLLGCVDEACGGNAASAASMLGVDLLITGRLTKLGKKADAQSVALDLTLMDAKTGARKGSTLVNAASESELIEKIPESVVALLGKVLEGKQGALVVSANETGATVKVDGTIVGTTPLEGRVALTAGPHALRVEKEGFVAAKKEIRVAPDALSEELVHMVPSPDFAAGYEEKESRIRRGAWLCAGTAVAGAVLFGVLQYQANKYYGDLGLPGTFAYERKALQDGKETEVVGDTTVNHRDNAIALASKISSVQNISYLAGGIGLAAAAASVTFFVIGDDPNRYKQFKATSGAPPKVSGMLFPGGGGAFAISGEF